VEKTVYWPAGNAIQTEMEELRAGIREGGGVLSAIDKKEKRSGRPEKAWDRTIEGRKQSSFGGSI